MARITVSRAVETPVDEVWPAMADLGSHVDWMRDAESIRFVTARTTGVGTRMEVETRVGPLRTLDVMEVTAWKEARSIEVTHQGLIKGQGTLAVAPRGEGTVVTWTEDLTFPWWLGGGITAWLARPILSAMWRGNLKRFEETIIAKGKGPGVA